MESRCTIFEARRFHRGMFKFRIDFFVELDSGTFIKKKEEDLQTASTKLATTFFCPAFSNSTVSLLPSISLIVP